MKTVFGFITVLLYFLQRVNSQACPDGPNVAKMCVSGTYTGRTVLLDTASYNSSVIDCTCTFQTTSNILKLITYVAPNYQGCNSALRLYSASGNNIRFQCLMSGTYLDTSVHKYGVATFEIYGEAYDTNYCLMLEIAGSIDDIISVKCTGNPEQGSDVMSTVQSPESDITTTEPSIVYTQDYTVSSTSDANILNATVSNVDEITTETTSASVNNNNTTEPSIVNTQYYTVSSTRDANILNNNPINFTVSVFNENTTETTLADVYTNNTTASSIVNAQDYTVSSTRDSDILTNNTVSVVDVNTTETASVNVNTNNTTESSIVYTQDYTVSSRRDANILNNSPINVTVSVVDENTTETTLADVYTNNTTASSIVNAQDYIVSSTRDANIPANNTVSVVDVNTTETTSANVSTNNATESIIVYMQDYTMSSTRDANISTNITVSVVDVNTTESSSANVNTNNATESSIVNTHDHTVSSTRDANILNNNPINVTMSIVDENTKETISANVNTNNTTEPSIINTQYYTVSSTIDANILNNNQINVTVSIVDENTTETNSTDVYTNNTTESSTVSAQDYTMSSTKDANILNANLINVTVSIDDENTTETTSADVYTNNTTASSIVNTQNYTTSSTRDAKISTNITISVVGDNTTETTSAKVNTNNNTTEPSIVYTQEYTVSATRDANILNNNPINVTVSVVDVNITETTSADHIKNDTTESSIVNEQDYKMSSTIDTNISTNVTVSVVDANTTETTSAHVITTNTTETTSAYVITTNTTEPSIVYTQDHTLSSTTDANILNNQINVTVSIVDENKTATNLANVSTNNTTEPSIVYTQDSFVSSSRDVSILNNNPINVTVSVVDENTTETTSADVNTTESSIVNAQDYTMSSTRDATFFNDNPINVTVLVANENTTETTSADVNTTESSIVNTQDYTTSSAENRNTLNTNQVNVSVSVDENTTETTVADVYTNNTTESNMVNTQDNTMYSTRNIFNTIPINVTVSVVDENSSAITPADVIKNNTTESSIINTQDYTVSRDTNILKANSMSVVGDNTAVNGTETEAIVVSEAEAQPTEQITDTVRVSSSPAIELTSLQMETTTESNPATDSINVMSTVQVPANALSNASTESVLITTYTNTTPGIANIWSRNSPNKLVYLAKDMTNNSLNLENSYQTTAAPLVVPSLILELYNRYMNNSVRSNVIPTVGITQNYSNTDKAMNRIVSGLPSDVPDVTDSNTSNSLHNVSANLDYAEATENNTTQINDVTTEDVTMTNGTGIVTGTMLFNGGSSDKPKTIQMIGPVTSDRLMDREEPSSNLTSESLVLGNTQVSTGSVKFTSNVYDTPNMGKHFMTQGTTETQADNAVTTTISVDLPNSLLTATTTTTPVQKHNVEGPINTTEHEVKHYGLQFPANQESIISINTTRNEMATQNISAITDTFSVSGDNTTLNSSEVNALNDIVDSNINDTVNDSHNITAEIHSPALPATEFKEPVVDFDISNSFANEAFSPSSMGELTLTTNEARYVTEDKELVAFASKITERSIETSTEVPTSQPDVAIGEYANNITSNITVVNATGEQSGFTTDVNNIVISTEVGAIDISNVTDPTNVHNETITPNSLDLSTAATSLETEAIQTDIAAASTVQQTSVRSVRSNDDLNTDVTTTASALSETTAQRIEATSKQVLNVESVAIMNTSSPPKVDNGLNQLNYSDPYSLQENNPFTLTASTVKPSRREDMFESMTSKQQMAINSTPNQETTIQVTEPNQFLTTPSEWMSFGLDLHQHLDLFSVETKVTTPSSAEKIAPESNVSEFTSNQDVFNSSMSNQETKKAKIEEQASTTPIVSYTSKIAQNNSVVSIVSTVTDRTTVTEGKKPAERATKVNLRALFASASGAGLPSPTDAVKTLINSNLSSANTIENNENTSYSTVASTESSGVYETSTVSAGTSSTVSAGSNSTVSAGTGSNVSAGTSSNVSAGTSSTVSAGTGSTVSDGTSSAVSAGTGSTVSAGASSTVSVVTSSTVSAGTITFSSGEINPVNFSSETIQPMKETLSATINLTTSTSLIGMEITSNENVYLNEKYTSTSVPIVDEDMIVKDTAMINNAEQVFNVRKKVALNPEPIDQNALDDFLLNLEKQIIQESKTMRTELQTTKKPADLKSIISLNEKVEITTQRDKPTSANVYKSTGTESNKIIPTEITPAVEINATSTVTVNKEIDTTDTRGDLVNVPTTPVQFFSVVDDTVVDTDKADPRQAETSDGNVTNVAFDTGNIGALNVDMNNDTYIMVVGAIVGLVVLAVVIGILCHRGRKRRSEKGNISANGPGVDPCTHQNQAFDNTADPEQGTNTVDIKTEESSGPTGQNGDTNNPPAVEQNGNIDL